MWWCSGGVVRFLLEILHFHEVMIEDIAEQGLGQWWPYRAVRRATGSPLESVLGDNGHRSVGLLTSQMDVTHTSFVGPCHENLNQFRRVVSLRVVSSKVRWGSR